MLGHVLAGLAGAGAGLLGSFIHAAAATVLPLGLMCALGLSLGIFLTAGALARARTGTAAAVMGWLLPVLLLSTPRPESDLVVPGSGLGYAWLLGGALLAGLSFTVPYADHRG